MGLKHRNAVVLALPSHNRHTRVGKSVNYCLLYEKWQEINVSMIIIILYSVLRMPSPTASSHISFQLDTLMLPIWKQLSRRNITCGVYKQMELHLNIVESL